MGMLIRWINNENNKQTNYENDKHRQKTIINISEKEKQWKWQTDKKKDNSKTSRPPRAHPNEPIDVHDGCDRDGSAGFACQGGRGRNHGSCGRVHSGALSPCGCSLAPAGREVELCRHAGGDHEDDQQGGYDGTNLRVDGEGYGLIIIIINLFLYRMFLFWLFGC